MVELLDERTDGIKTWKISSDRLSAIVSSFGATILEILVSDAKGNEANVVLGYPDIEDYMAKPGTYFGATVGRTANRIKNGTFTLNDQEYHLPINNGPNCNHGGIDGFSYRNFESKQINDETLRMTYFAKDGEEGYPGNMKFEVLFTVDGNTLRIDFTGKSDQDTLFAPTNHSYFNLSGATSDPYEETLQIMADKFGQVDPDGLATGTSLDVEGTPLDFREPKPIKDAMDFDVEQIRLANGVDHHFTFDENRDLTKDVLVLRDPVSGRSLHLKTSLPGVQIYTANYQDPCKGRQGDYQSRWGIAVEAQCYPDGIHHQENPDMFVQAFEERHWWEEFTFEID